MEMPTLMFLGDLEEKIAEINMAVFPQLILLDARSCIITGGPRKGTIAQPNLILASGDRVAIDVAGVEILQDYSLRQGAKNRLIYDNPFSYFQIKHAAELGIGVQSGSEIKKIC